MTDLAGQVAVVTGASRGIGRGVAVELASRGASVAGVYERDDRAAREASRAVREASDRWAAVSRRDGAKWAGHAAAGRRSSGRGKGARDADDGLELAAERAPSHRMYKADASRASAVERVRRAVLRDFGRVDILVNNAGIHQHLRSWELSEKDWRRVMEVNLTSQFLCSKAFGAGMRERRSGRIVNVTSMIAWLGTDHEVHYAASKGGSVSLTRALALEYAPYGVTVNAVAPGYIRTDMLVFDRPSDEEKHRKRIPLARYGEPSDIARAVAFLCSEDASYVTGQVLHVNGGLLMG